MLIRNEQQERCHIKVGEVAAMPELLGLEADAWPCPRLAAHPPGRSTAATTTHIDWTKEEPVRLRIVDYTCSCRALVYELLSYGGHYMIRRTHQTTSPKVFYAGPWPRAVAERVWTMILTGEAR
jgi:hypothetical protein